MASGGRRAIVIAKRSSWERLVEVGKDAHVIELVRRGDPTVARMRAAHEAHLATVRETDAALEKLGLEVARVEDPHAPFDTDDALAVITIGGDGTLLAASHQVNGTPILAINSAPAHSVGFFCGTEAGQVEETLGRLAKGVLPGVLLSRMSVTKNGRVVSRRVLNDALLCHASPAATSRYILELGSLTEEQKSSGFWIGPAAGSTAAQRSAGGNVLPLDSTDIQLVVREPYTPRDRPLKIIHEILPAGAVLRVRSKMKDARMFLDGPAIEIELTLGDVVEFTRSEESLLLLGIDEKRSRC